MSGQGQAPTNPIDCNDLRVAVVAASWHSEVMDGLIDGAVQALADYRVDSAPVVRVPGSFELPVVAQRLAQQGFEAIVALGVVIRGGTPHFEYVCQAVTEGLGRVALDHGVAVGFGLLTCDNDAQALDRAGLSGSKEDKGYEAAAAALETGSLLRGLPQPELLPVP